MTAQPPKDRPIIFSAPMVRALLDGRKTQTRRIVKDVPPMPEADCHPKHRQIHPAPYLDSYCSRRPKPSNPRGMSDRWCWWQVDDRACLPQFSVPYVPGDRLWVRENYARVGDNADDIHACPDLRVHAYYAADSVQPKRLRWRPSIHMPRWASRLTLIVTDVRVQRLQDISEADAKAEGAVATTCANVVAPKDGFPSYRSGFGLIWNTINGEGAWETNPWVVAVSFRTIKANIDSAEAKAA